MYDCRIRTASTQNEIWTRNKAKYGKELGNWENETGKVCSEREEANLWSGRMNDEI